MSSLELNGIAMLLGRLSDADLLAQSFAEGDLFGGEFGGNPSAQGRSRCREVDLTDDV
jgi:hypothetical protein